MGSMTLPLVFLAAFLLARWYLFPRARMGMSALRKVAPVHDAERWQKLQIQATGASFTGILDTVIVEGVPMRIHSTTTALGAVVVQTAQTSTVDLKANWSHEPELAAAIEMLAGFGKRAELVSNASGIRLTLGGPVSSTDVHDACRVVATLVQHSGASSMPYR